MQTCQYKKISHAVGDVEFGCDEPTRTEDSSLCIFHDNDYRILHREEYEQIAAKRFDEKVSQSLIENKPLQCRGYTILASFIVSMLDKQKIPQAIDFTASNFIGEVSFSWAKFGKANFSRTEFEGEVSFHMTEFKEVDFSRAVFKNSANFLYSKFKGKKGNTNFDYTEFQEAIFVDAKFEGTASFQETIFKRRAIFNGAIFSKNADFVVSKFIDEANFSKAKFSMIIRF